ncbi:MAG TPA: FAD-dependent oxidoreductase [Candidatus Saccharimonadales bacterium]
MPVVNVKITKKREVANGTLEVTIEKPEGFEFRAGQFCDYTLLDPPETDDEGNTRGFSIVTAPYEDHLALATRLRDTAFKRVLKDLPEGAELKLDGPYGDFTLHKNENKPAVFIIGGIGVTPVRSMIAQATHDKTEHKITLIHSNKTPADAPFTSDFEALAKENPNFTFVPTVETAPDGWQGETGRIDAGMVKKYVSDFENTIFYLAGPPGMVKAMRTLLVDELKADEDNIRTEEFDGY